MIWRYLRERVSWLLLLLALQAVILFVAYVDSSIPLQSLLYVVVLNVVICIVFVWARYPAETRFYRRMETWDHTYDLSELGSPGSPHEQIVHDAVVAQTERYRKESTANMLLLEQEKDEMVAWIHEVKTPLTALQLMIERMPDDRLKGQMTYEWVRIHQLLDRQLHQKRIPFMHNDLFIEPTELEPIIHAEIRAIRSWCISKGIGFEVELAESHVLTDGKWLGFILRQLLSNAVKYSPSSDVVIASRVVQGHVVLTIQDRGRGIDARDLPRIFDKGYTSAQGRMEGAATGMGLYLSRQVAEALRIRLDVSSVVGEGTLVTLTFARENEMAHLSGM